MPGDQTAQSESDAEQLPAGQTLVESKPSGSGGDHGTEQSEERHAYRGEALQPAEPQHVPKRGVDQGQVGESTDVGRGEAGRCALYG